MILNVLTLYDPLSQGKNPVQVLHPLAETLLAENFGHVKLAAGCRLLFADSKHKDSSRLPVADSKHKVSSVLPLPIQLPVADSVADSIQTSSTNWQLETCAYADSDSKQTM